MDWGTTALPLLSAPRAPDPFEMRPNILHSALLLGLNCSILVNVRRKRKAGVLL